jgi:hypothetical protein
MSVLYYIIWGLTIFIVLFGLTVLFGELFGYETTGHLGVPAAGGFTIIYGRKKIFQGLNKIFKKNVK